MASNVVYVHDLAFQPRKELCRILDADRRWEELGGLMGYDVTTLILIGQAVLRDRSPTWDLLNKFSEKNGTTNQLYKMLAHIDHQRAMLLLAPYVDTKYHCLLRNENSTSSSSFSKMELLYGSSQLSSSRHHKELSKFQPNFVNLDTHQTKMNSLNAQAKKVSKLHNFKETSSNLKEESTSDNCIPDKMKSVKSLKEAVSQTAKQHKQSSLLACGGSEDCLPDILRIPYEEIRCSTDDFNRDRILGRGGFGTVYRGEWKGTSVAIKRLTPKFGVPRMTSTAITSWGGGASGRGEWKGTSAAIKRLTPRPNAHGPSLQLVSLKQSLNELNILKTCRFDHILPLYAVSLDGENPCLIYQLMVNGSLEDRLLLKHHTPPLTWSQRSHIAECTTKGLNYLHTSLEKPLVHGDIKSANILLDANMDAKIGDFGLTREGPGCQDTHVKVSSVHGTECYLPPEYLRQKHLSPQVDIYSYGIVLLEIATGLRPFDAKRGKGKRLPDHVAMCVEGGRLDSLRDPKAGEEKCIWFRELVRIGQICSSLEKRKRPPMEQMLKEFERIKQEMSMMDIIRRLSTDKEPLPPDLPPIGIQMYYDMHRQTGTTQGQNTSHGQNEPTRDTKENGATSPPPQAPVATPKEETPPQQGPDAPLPLLSILRLQVSEVGENSSCVEMSSQTVDSASSDYISED
ncbi:hypothetical protein JTE90_003744 [Oedothorax gibbosus]|uniref:non-specific serine/threonine protein kinase n=1 Tax=Oedothorax gibbosus TaxID=931172 RepID=A0AAV6VAA8_9ARAC|nr:hypothetical protein JTE90_003744 [Oedothorax gibbosus]